MAARLGKALGLAGAALALSLGVAGCVRAPAMPPGAVLDSPRFAERRGYPDYATTIRYIDDHVRYEEFDTRFAVGPAGDMCYGDEPGSAWCIPPRAVGEVRMDRYVEVHCSKWFPLCAYRLAGGSLAGQAANRVQLRERFEDRAKLVAAVRHLVYLMGGPDPRPDPFAAADGSPGG
jgi:hypothetical protein